MSSTEGRSGWYQGKGLPVRGVLSQSRTRREATPAAGHTRTFLAPQRGRPVVATHVNAARSPESFGKVSQQRRNLERTKNNDKKDKTNQRKHACEFTLLCNAHRFLESDILTLHWKEKNFQVESASTQLAGGAEGFLAHRGKGTIPRAPVPPERRRAKKQHKSCSVLLQPLYSSRFHHVTTTTRTRTRQGPWLR